nr:ATP-binding cassette domain-containing protein [Haloarcula sp. CK38]
MPSTGEGLAIQVTDLRKSYDSEVALESLSLAIQPGTVYGFLGPNGAGKTTTMRLLTGLTQPSSGTSRVCGIDLSAGTVKRYLYELTEDGIVERIQIDESTQVAHRAVSSHSFLLTSSRGSPIRSLNSLFAVLLRSQCEYCSK